ncbi:MAG: hypothetical protein K9I94_13135, partial [Bacteroidales bacterium]|nr:hypothetical protein [Bacteroidales bacterium]
MKMIPKRLSKNMLGYAFIVYDYFCYKRSLLSGENAFSKEISRFMPIPIAIGIIGIKLGMTGCYGSGKGGWR